MKGPTALFECGGCRFHESERYSVQGDSGTDHSCTVEEVSVSLECHDPMRERRAKPHKLCPYMNDHRSPRQKLLDKVATLTAALDESKEKVEGLEHQLALKNRPAHYSLCYDAGDYPFNHIDLTLADYGHSDHAFVLTSDELDAKLKTGKQAEAKVARLEEDSNKYRDALIKIRQHIAGQAPRKRDMNVVIYEIIDPTVGTSRFNPDGKQAIADSEEK